MSTIRWMGQGGTVSSPTSGDYSQAANWDAGVVPGLNDDAVLGSGTYTVSLKQDAELNSLYVGQDVSFTSIGDSEKDALYQMNVTTTIENYGSINVVGNTLEASGTISNFGSLETDFLVQYGLPDFANGEVNGALANFGSLHVGFGSGAGLTVVNVTNGVLSDGYWSSDDYGFLFADTSNITTVNTVVTSNGAHGVNTLAGVATIGSKGVVSILGTNTTQEPARTLFGKLYINGRYSGGLITAYSGSVFEGGSLTSDITTAGVVGGTNFSGNNRFFGRIEFSAEFSKGTDLLGSGLRVVASDITLSGAAVTLGANLAYAGNLDFSAGSLDLHGFNASLTGTATLTQHALVSGAGILAFHGTTSIGNGAAFSVGAALNNYATLNQVGRLTLNTGTAANGGVWTQTDATASLITVGESFSNIGVFNQRGIVMLNSSTIANRGTWNEIGTTSLVPSAGGTGAFTNGGTFHKTGGGVSTISTAFENRGSASVDDGTLFIRGEVTGAGSFEVHAGSVLEFRGAVAAGETVTLDAGASTLFLDNGRSFKGTVAGLVGDAAVDLGGFATAGATLAYMANKGNTGGVLEVRSGSSIADITFAGQYLLSAFHATADGHGGTDITYGTQQQQAQLAVGHT